MRYACLAASLLVSACSTGSPLTITAGPAPADAHTCFVRAAAAADFRVITQDATAGQVRAEREQSTSRSPLSPADVDTFLDRIDITALPNGTRATVSFVQRTTSGRNVGAEQVHGPRPEARAAADSILAACL